jgi:hypothetical protein
VIQALQATPRCHLDRLDHKGSPTRAVGLRASPLALAARAPRTTVGPLPSLQREDDAADSIGHRTGHADEANAELALASGRR